MLNCSSNLTRMVILKLHLTGRSADVVKFEVIVSFVHLSCEVVGLPMPIHNGIVHHY